MQKWSKEPESKIVLQVFCTFSDKLYGDEAETGDSGDGYLSVEHLKTYEQEENLKLLEEFRKVLDAATEEDASRPR